MPSDYIIDNLKKYPPIADHYDLEFDDKAFEGMEVTMGPKSTDSEKLIVEALLHKFNKDAEANITESTLKINKNKH